MNIDLAPYALKRHSASFTLAAALLSRRTKAQVETLYRLCRAIDDAADIDAAQRAPSTQFTANNLAELTAALDADNNQHLGADHPWLAEIDALPGNAWRRRRCLLRLTQTCTEDMVPARKIADEQALLAYAYGVAGTVGLMMLPLLGVADQSRDLSAVSPIRPDLSAVSPDRRELNAAARHACALGMAMQLSNIARDVVADAAIGRVYLPQSWLLAPLDVAALARGAVVELEKCVPALVRLLALAEVLYRAGMSGLHYIPIRNRTAVAVAAKVYREIGRQVQRELGELGFARRTVVSTPRKLLLCLSGLLLSIKTAPTETSAELAMYLQPMLIADGFAD